MSEFPYRPWLETAARAAAPSGFAFSGEDHLRVVSSGSLAGVTLEIAGRFLSTTGEITPFIFVQTANSARTTTTSDLQLGDGWLLGITVRPSIGAPAWGQTFVSLRVIRGQTGATIALATLAADYVTDVARLAWPGSPTGSPSDTPGVIRAVTGTNPAAGAEITETVPTGARWRVVSIGATLVTDGTVATRRASLTYDDGATVFFRSAQVQTQLASVTRRYTWAAGLPVETIISAEAAVAGLPVGGILTGGMRILTATESLQAADDWGAPLLLVEEWIGA